MQIQEKCNSTVLSWDNAVHLIGKKVQIELEPSGKKRTGYVVDIYNEKTPFLVLEIGHNLYEDRIISEIRSFKVV